MEVYHTKIRLENEQIIQKADNAIEAMAYLHHRIVHRASQTNPNFFNDILHYYPGMLQESYRKNGNFAHQELVYLGEWGIADGIFLKDLDIEVVVKNGFGFIRIIKRQ